MEVIYALQSNNPINELIAQAYPALTKLRREEYNIPCEKASGFFKNIDPFFGPGRIELLHIEPKKQDRTDSYRECRETHIGGWQARKLVGDANVPRGKLSWVTHAYPVQRILNGRPVMAVVQVRQDTSNPGGFSWMHGVRVKYDSEEDTWSVCVHNYGYHKFVRVEAEEAKMMQNARSGEDWA